MIVVSPVAPPVPSITTLDELPTTTHADVFDGEPRVVRLSLDAGQEIAPHRHPGSTVVLHLLAGRLDLGLDGETHALDAGDVIRFSGDRAVAPAAVEDSVALVVFAPTEGDGTSTEDG